jgi:hypothetical protein
MEDYHPLSRSLLIFNPMAYQPNLGFRSYLSGDPDGSLHMLRTVGYSPNPQPGEVSNLQIRRKCHFLAQKLVPEIHRWLHQPICGTYFESASRCVLGQLSPEIPPAIICRLISED